MLFSAVLIICLAELIFFKYDTKNSGYILQKCNLKVYVHIVKKKKKKNDINERLEYKHIIHSSCQERYMIYYYDERLFNARYNTSDVRQPLNRV